MNGYEDKLKELLSQHDWYYDRQGKGSHEIWKKNGCPSQTLPKGCKSRHLANAILKMCGINHKF